MITIDYRDPRPIYEQIKDEFKELIFRGILETDEQLPSVRELSARLAINPNTIQRAYRELEQEGYTYSVKGKGSFISGAQNHDSERQRNKLFAQISACAEELLYLGVTKEEIINVIERNEK